MESIPLRAFIYLMILIPIDVTSAIRRRIGAVFLISGCGICVGGVGFSLVSPTASPSTSRLSSTSRVSIPSSEAPSSLTGI